MSNLPAIQQVRADLDANEALIASNLPAGIGIEKFKTVVLTALSRKPDLLKGERQSLINSCVMCAQDGLLPDGREAALTIYNTKVKDAQGRDVWVDAVQYMPMVYGIRKRLHNGGEVNPPVTDLVHRHDVFRVWTDDTGQHLLHEPLTFGDRGEVVGAYAMARGKDGSLYVEVMTKQEIEKIRGKSKAATKGPWVDWWGEMARKSVLRRLSKGLPMGADVERIFRREDDVEGDYIPTDVAPDRPALSDFSQDEAEEPTGDIYRVTDEFGCIEYKGPSRAAATEKLREMASVATEDAQEALRELNPDLWGVAMFDHVGSEFGLPAVEEGKPDIKALWENYLSMKDNIEALSVWVSKLPPKSQRYVRKCMEADGIA